MTDAPLVTANNYAEAGVNSCRHCGATAIAFQVVLVSKHALATQATDTALATTQNCTTCNSLAEAFQMVYATDQCGRCECGGPVRRLGVAFQLRGLQYSGLSTGQIQARSTGIINNFVSWLQSSSEDSTGQSP